MNSLAAMMAWGLCRRHVELESHQSRASEVGEEALDSLGLSNLRRKVEHGAVSRA